MTPEEVGLIWNSLEKPGLGTVRKLCKAAGTDVSETTIARYRDAGWKSKEPHGNKGGRPYKSREERASREVARRLPDGLMQEYLDRLTGEETLEHKKENAKKAMTDGYSMSWFSFMRHSDHILKKHPMAFAAILNALTDGYRAVNEPSSDQQLIVAKDITPTDQDSDDRELRELLSVE
jgi:hypothetical protein